MGNEESCWGHSSSEDPESFVGTFKTREEVIDDGRSTYDDDFWICEGKHPELDRLLPSTDQILDWMAERAHEEASESADGFPEVGEEGKKALKEALFAWGTKHVAITFWMAVGDPEKVSIEESPDASAPGIP